MGDRDEKMYEEWANELNYAHELDYWHSWAKEEGTEVAWH